MPAKTGDSAYTANKASEIPCDAAFTIGPIKIKPTVTETSSTMVGVIKERITEGRTLFKNFSIGAAKKHVIITGNTVEV